MGSGFKIFTAGPLSSADVNGFLMQQVTATVTSTTRPASPTPGQRIYETDTDISRYWNGVQWAYDQSRKFVSYRSSPNSSDALPFTSPTPSFAAQVVSGAIGGLQAGQLDVELQLVLSASAPQQGNVRVTVQIDPGGGYGTTIGESGIADIDGNPPADITTSRQSCRYYFPFDHPGGNLTLRAYVQATAAGALVWTSGSMLVAKLLR